MIGDYNWHIHVPCFPSSSAGKESACNAGDSDSIPGLGRSAGEGIGYPLQYSWASLVAQPVKNPPAVWETWVRSLGWEDPLEKGTATHSSILAWRIPWTTVAKSRTRLRDFEKKLYNKDVEALLVPSSWAASLEAKSYFSSHFLPSIFNQKR